MTAQLVIAGITIKTDDEGRYCLNDFHKAAGERSKDRPVHFLALDTTKELVAELMKSENLLHPVNIIRGRGRPQGTYVVRELVYAYAMWISPSFHLKVIRTFDELQTKGMVMTPAVAKQAVESPEEFLARAVLIAQESLEKAKKALEEKDKQIEHLSILMTVNNFLTKHGLPVNQGNKNRLSAKARRGQETVKEQAEVQTKQGEHLSS